MGALDLYIFISPYMFSGKVIQFDKMRKKERKLGTYGSICCGNVLTKLWQKKDCIACNLESNFFFVKLLMFIIKDQSFRWSLTHK